MKKLLLALLLTVSCLLTAKAQSFYVNAYFYDYLSGTGQTVLFRVSVQPSGLKYEPVQQCSDELMYSIGMDKSGFYWTNLYGILFRADLNGLTMSNCRTLMQLPTTSSALTVGGDGKLYYTGSSLFTTDPRTLETAAFGDMYYYASGDLTFYKGNLYMAAVGGAGIVKIDIKDPAKSQPYMELNLTNVFGLITVSKGLHQNTVYALDAVGIAATDVYEIDLENKRIIQKIGTLPFTVYDAASDVESGNVLGIDIKEIKAYRQCPDDGKGIIEVINSSATAGYTYSINGGAANTTGIFNNLDPGRYKIHVQSPSDQLDTTITISKFNLLKPQLNITSKQPECFSTGAVTFTAVNSQDAGAFKLLYQNKVYPLNQTFELPAGKYHFDIVNNNSCVVDSANFTLTQQVCKIKIDKVKIQEECDQIDKGRIQVTAKPYPDPLTYSLNNVKNTTGLFGSLQPGSYHLTISSSTDIKDTTLIVPNFRAAKPVVSYIKTDLVCDTQGVLKFNMKNGDPAAYQLRHMGSIYPFDQTFHFITSGTYHFEVLKADGCLSDTLNITFLRKKCSIYLDKVNTNEECEQPGKGMAAVTTLPHTYKYTYTINGTMANATGTFNNLNPGTYNIKVSSSEDEKTVSVTIPDYNAAKPLISAAIVKPVCDTLGSIQLLVGGKVNNSLYRIRYNAMLYPADHLFNNLSEGSYHFEVIKTDGCVLNSIDVLLPRRKCEIFPMASTIARECDLIFKGSIKVNTYPHTYAYSYTLSDGQVNHTGLFNDLKPGTYSIRITSSEDSKQVTAVIPDYKLSEPTISAVEKNQICDLPGSVAFTMSGSAEGYKVRYDGATYPFDHVFQNLTEGVYSFSIIKPNGCLLDIIPVRVGRDECEPVLFPNAFSPNGDGVNDVFRPNPRSTAFNFKFNIYNRWGTAIFTSTNSHEGWDGRYKGAAAPTGVYYWTATYIKVDGIAAQQSGSVTLIR